MIRTDIEKAIVTALQGLGVSEVPFVVERPADMEHGDYATNVALAAGKELKKAPKEVAQMLTEALKGKIDGVEKIEVAGPGFINFYLARDVFASEVSRAVADDTWASGGARAEQVVMVEYTDPNPFKEFHIGHLMSNAIGESIARLLESGGAKVLRANYQGDVGPHVAKGLWGLMQAGVTNPTVEDLGSAYVAGAAAYEESAETKAEIDTINKKVYEKSDRQINDLYEKGRILSLHHFEQIYKTLGTKFDFYFFESETGELGLDIVHKHKDVFEESEGATVYRGERDGLHTRVFVNKLGLPTYEAKDLGLLKLKASRAQFDQSISVTANEQDEYFKVVLAAAKRVPEIKDVAHKTTHVSHGMMKFASGKMSSRKGNVVTGESLLNDLVTEAKEKMKSRELKDKEVVAEQIAVAAIKFAILKQGSGKDIVFDPEKSLSLDGDSGPYVQYAHTRALSLIRAAKEAGVSAGGDDAPAHAHALERVLVHFSDALERSVEELEPHFLATYLLELASTFNSWYASERVVGGSHPQYGLLLVEAVEQTLRRGLAILGIQTPGEM